MVRSNRWQVVRPRRQALNEALEVGNQIEPLSAANNLVGWERVLLPVGTRETMIGFSGGTGRNGPVATAPNGSPRAARRDSTSALQELATSGPELGCSGARSVRL